MALLELRDLKVSYGGLHALNGVSFAIDRGAVGLLGPNGAGKTTLLRALLGFVRPDGGVIELFDKRLPEGKLHVRQRLGYMPEGTTVSPKVSAVNFLSYCGSLFGMTRVDAMERAHEVLNYVGLGESRYRKMQTYSTGMLQRVKFAQALIHDPRLLLLDEPTNGLDPDGRIEMLELIRELAHKRGVAILLSTHLMPDVEHVCDRVIVINKGRVVRDGCMDDLMAVRDGLYELRVRDNKEVFLAALEGAGCRCRDEQDGMLLITKPPRFEVREFFEAARAHNTQIRHFRPVRQRLEEVFMEAIAEKPAEAGAAADEELASAMER